jgi:hypothetical protein
MWTIISYFIRMAGERESYTTPSMTSETRDGILPRTRAPETITVLS